MKRFFPLFVLICLVLFAGPVLAKPDFSSRELVTSGTARVLTLPPASDNSPVISLGTAVDPQSGKVVEGFAIIHPKKGFHHRPGHNGGPGAGSNGGSSCYSFLSNGAKWKTVESWVTNTENSESLSSDFILNNLTSDITKWEDAAGFDILGVGSTTATALVADTQSPDGSNEVYFADVSSSGAIAVTIVWGIFSGPPFARELVEWDQVYDDVDFEWSSTGEAGKMDFENIATHELGHALGMGHSDDSCTEETMYRFASEGETKKQTLNAGDITGIAELYK